MEITPETIEYISTLANLKLKEEEKVQTKKDLEQILEYIGIIQELDTKSIEPLTHIVQQKNVFREDEVKESINREQILKNAPVIKEGCFTVPKAVDA